MLNIKKKLLELTAFGNGHMSCDIHNGLCEGLGKEHAICWFCKACGEHLHSCIKDGKLIGVCCPHSLN